MTYPSSTPGVPNTDQSNENRQNLNLDETKSWIYELEKNDTKTWKSILLLSVKLFVRSLMLIYIVVIFGRYYIKCFTFMWRIQIVNDAAMWLESRAQSAHHRPKLYNLKHTKKLPNLWCDDV